MKLELECPAKRKTFSQTARWGTLAHCAAFEATTDFYLKQVDAGAMLCQPLVYHGDELEHEEDTMHFCGRKPGVLTTGLGFSAALYPLTGAAVSIETRALIDDPAAGTTPGVVFEFLTAPSLNNAGEIAFIAEVVGPGVSDISGNNVGIWSEAAGSLGSPGLAAGAGAAPAGFSPGVSLINLSTPVLNDAGQSAFLATLIGPGIDATTSRGVWSNAAGAGGAVGLVAREGFAAPGAGAGVVFDTFFEYAQNNAGQTAFRGSLEGAGVTADNDRGLWSEAAGAIGSPGLVAREGSAAPGTGAGVVFGGSIGLSNVFSAPLMNSAGQTAFLGSLTGTGVDASNNVGLWSEAAGSIGSPGLVARTGSAAPGTGPGVVFVGFEQPRFNDVGETAFLGGLAGPGVGATNFAGLWSEAAGTIGTPGLVVRSGDPAPGAGPGVVFTFFSPPALNDTGQTLFGGILAGPGIDTSNDEGIWLDPAGSVGAAQLLVREGDSAPGTSPGVVFDSFESLLLNDAGQATLLATIDGPGLDPDTQGIWMADSDGTLSLIVHEGEVLDVDDDPEVEDLRTVTSFSLVDAVGRGAGRASSFNDAGQLAFLANFSDGSSGLFVASLAAAAIPGDYNADGSVNQGDLDLVLLNWGDDASATGVPSGWVNFQPTGVIGQTQLDGVLLNWGNTQEPGGSAVPEPASAVLLALVSTVAWRRRRAA